MMDKSIANANRILREAFCSWISTTAVDIKDSGLRFGENCIFINFSYTDTLEKRFGVDGADIIHIHGEASDAESIIFGHSSHPQEPEGFLYKLGGRFRGLFLVESVLYKTDKHVKENITGYSIPLSDMVMTPLLMSLYYRRKKQQYIENLCWNSVSVIWSFIRNSLR